MLFVIGAIVLLPIAAIVWMAFFPTDNIWPHLISTTLPRYVGATATLMFVVGAGAAVESFEPRKATLEDAFLRLTKGRVQ